MCVCVGGGVTSPSEWWQLLLPHNRLPRSNPHTRPARTRAIGCQHHHEVARLVACAEQHGVEGAAQALAHGVGAAAQEGVRLVDEQQQAAGGWGGGGRWQGRRGRRGRGGASRSLQQHFASSSSPTTDPPSSSHFLHCVRLSLGRYLQPFPPPPARLTACSSPPSQMSGAAV